MAVIRRPARTTPLDLTLLQREVNQLFERLADFDRADRPAEGEWIPSVDVYECRGKLIIVVEVPGLPPESLRVTFRDRQLIITGERRERRPPPASPASCAWSGRRAASRAPILLDVAVDVRQAEARLAGGLLTVTIPRVKDRRGRETVIPVRRDGEDRERSEA